MAARIFRIAGVIVLAFYTLLIASVGWFFLALITPLYTCFEKDYFSYLGQKYEVRKYAIGHDDMRYTFSTYHEFKCLPIERKIDQTDFFLEIGATKVKDSLIDLNAWGPLQFSIIDIQNHQCLVMQDDNGKRFIKKL